MSHYEELRDGTAPPTGRENRRHLWLHVEFLRRCLRVDELENGYALAYPNSKVWAERVREIAAHWQQRLPFFEVEVTPDGNPDLLWLRISGPEGAKEYLEEIIALAAPASELSRRLDLRMSLAGRAKRRADFAVRRATSALRVLPDFLVVGAARCGTSALYRGLTQHPSVAPAFRKEVYFFDHNFEKGVSYYRAFFPTVLEKRNIEKRCAEGFLTGEATPCYFFHPHVPARVAKVVPNVKLIALLRNPVDRAYSHYWMKLRKEYENASFEDAVERETERVNGELSKMLEDEHYFSYDRWHFSYLARGLYAEQLARWMKFFPREQFLILRSEDLYRDPAATYKRVSEFLGLPPWQPSRPAKSNFVPYPEMDRATRARLLEYFAPHNERLYELLGTRFEWDR